MNDWMGHLIIDICLCIKKKWFEIMRNLEKGYFYINLKLGK